MSLEWLSSCTCCQWSQHRGFDFDVAMIFEYPAKFSNGTSAPLEYFSRYECLIFIKFQTAGNEICITLSLTNLGIVNAVHLVGHWQKRFRQELKLLNVDREFTSLRHEEIAFDAYEVAMIQELEKLPAVHILIDRIVSYT